MTFTFTPEGNQNEKDRGIGQGGVISTYFILLFTYKKCKLKAGGR